MLYGLNTKPDGTGQWATLHNVATYYRALEIKLYDTPERSRLYSREQDAEAKAKRWFRSLYVRRPEGGEDVRALYVIPLKLTVEVPGDAAQS